VNLRAQAEADLAVTLEDTGGFGLPIVLIDPDGATQEVTGQVLYDSIETTAEGLSIIVHRPVVTVRRSSLTRVPLPTDSPRWACRVPTSPVDGAAMGTFLVERPEESGGSLGFVRLYLAKAEQE
jgi:hypothetical protein